MPIAHALARKEVIKPEGVGELLLPYVPANMNTEAIRTHAVTSDVYGVCERLRELNPRLHVEVSVDLSSKEHPGRHVFTITEWMDPAGDKIEVVFRTTSLDPRVVRYVEYLLKVPVAQRFREAERMEEEHKAAEHDRELDDLTERVGLPMQHELRKNGFLDGRYSHRDVDRSRRRFGAGA